MIDPSPDLGPAPTTEPHFVLTVHGDGPPDDEALVDAGLGAHNEQAAPLHEVLPLACFMRTASGAAVGGAIGRTWGRCCELQQLWVQPAQRRQGLGSRLVRAFEQQAQARACDLVYLETFSFQAPALYLALGYEVTLELQGFAPGVSKYVMLRRLQPLAAPTQLVRSPP